VAGTEDDGCEMDVHEIGQAAAIIAGGIVAIIPLHAAMQRIEKVICAGCHAENIYLKRVVARQEKKIQAMDRRSKGTDNRRKDA